MSNQITPIKKRFFMEKLGTLSQDQGLRSVYQLFLQANSLVFELPNSCKLLVIQDLWNIQWLGFPGIPIWFEKGFGKLSFWNCEKNTFRKISLQNWVLIFYSFFDWTKNLETATPLVKGSLLGLFYLRFLLKVKAV